MKFEYLDLVDFKGVPSSVETVTPKGEASQSKATPTFFCGNIPGESPKGETPQSTTT